MESICRKHKIYVMIIWYDCSYGNRRPIRALNANRLDHQTISTASPSKLISIPSIHIWHMCLKLTLDACTYFIFAVFYQPFSRKALQQSVPKKSSKIFAIVFFSKLGLTFSWVQWGWEIKMLNFSPLCIFKCLTHERLGDYTDHIGRLREFECHNSNFKSLITCPNWNYFGSGK